MRPLTARARQTRLSTRHACGLALATTLLATGLLAPVATLAQGAPETLRIEVNPPKPGIRAVTLDGRYRPVISRDDTGVVIDALGSSSSAPPCDVKLQVTLENSRVLNRDANICSGGTLVVDVEDDGRPGAARVINGTGPAPIAGTAASNSGSKSAASSSTASPATSPSAPAAQAQTQVQAPTSGASGSARGADKPANGAALKPLEPSGTLETTKKPEGGSDLSSIVGESLNRHRDGGQPPAAATGGQTVIISGSENRTWQAEPGNIPGDKSYLTHGVPGTDDIDFRAACLTQSGQATIVFAQTSASTSEGKTEPVSISSGGFSMTYSAVGSSRNNQYGQSFPQIALPMTDPLWQAMIKESQLTIQVQGTPAYSVSLKGSATPVRLFLATCAEAQKIVGEDPALLPGAAGGNLIAQADVSCTEAGRIRSLEAERNGEIIFRNDGGRPVDVNWIDYDGAAQYFATLQPGQVLNQPTYVSHAWLVRESNGPCLGIYVSRTPYREVVISGGRAPAPVQPGFGAPAGGDGWSQPGSIDGFGGPAGPIPPGDIGGGRSLGPNASWQPAPVSSTSAGGPLVNYLCTGGADLQVSFSAGGDRVTVAEMGQYPVTLPRISAGTNFLYAEGAFAFQGQERSTTWSRPGAQDVYCLAQ